MYRRFGPDCVKQFNGMWAFVIYDAGEQKLFISRDRLGIRPFYYLLNESGFAFASEIKALFGEYPGERIPNEPYIKQFIISGLFDFDEATLFKNIKQLPGAHSAALSLKSGGLKISRYWEVNEDAFRERWCSGESPDEAFEPLITSAIAACMDTDAPLAACLSGGIDSSLICAVASKNLSAPLRTFSAHFPDKGFDEREYSEAVNAHIGSAPIPVEAEPMEDITDLLRRMTWHQDGPAAGPTLITQFAVMRAASENGIKVLLDGQGPDEMFSGYVYYLPTYLMELWKSGKIRDRLRALRLGSIIAEHWGEQLVPGGILRLLLKKAKPAAPYIAPEFTAAFSARAPEAAAIPPLKPLKSALNNLCHIQTVQQSIPALLHYEDRNSAAWSVEARCPMMDNSVTEYAMGLPPEYKVYGECWTKWPLRKLAGKLLPEKVAWRRSKMGYPTPFLRWLREGVNVEPMKRLLDQFKLRDIVTPETVDRYYAQHMASEADNSWMLYRFITLELWYQLFIDDFTPSPAGRNPKL